jgi:hypothetical protein
MSLKDGPCSLGADASPARLRRDVEVHDLPVERFVQVPGRLGDDREPERRSIDANRVAGTAVADPPVMAHAFVERARAR